MVKTVLHFPKKLIFHSKPACPCIPCGSSLRNVPNILYLEYPWLIGSILSYSASMWGDLGSNPGGVGYFPLLSLDNLGEDNLSR